MIKSLTIVLLALLGSIFSFVIPAAASDAAPTCIKIVVDLSNSASMVGTVEIRLLDAGDGNRVFYDHTISVPANGTTQLQYFVGVTIVGPIAATFPVVSSGVSGLISDHTVPLSNCPSGPGHIDDGRINTNDLGAPLAAYCDGGGMKVWDIDASGQGTLAFSVTLADILKALTDAVASGQNVLVGQGMDDSLYALSSNQLVLIGPDINTPSKNYEFLTTPNVCL
ncbi:MAG: hypothetical protein GC183_11650 [Thiobacillus sp.]|nr:hypothetical protein [Thiobacillus sp.]